MDYQWVIENTPYVIRNVPFERCEDGEYFDIDTSTKIAAIRDLMYENEIPHDVNYEVVADLEY